MYHANIVSDYIMVVKICEEKKLFCVVGIICIPQFSPCYKSCGSENGLE